MLTDNEDIGKVSANSTFSIEEEESYLNHFGTPVNFKKLMEKPVKEHATIDQLSFDNLKLSPLNMKPAARLGMKERQNFSGTNIKSSPKSHHGNIEMNLDAFSHSTPIRSKNSNNRNAKENVHPAFRSRYLSPKVVEFKTPTVPMKREQKPKTEISETNQSTSPSSFLLWSLEKKKMDAARLEEQRKQLELEERNQGKGHTGERMTSEEINASFLKTLQKISERNFAQRQLEEELEKTKLIDSKKKDCKLDTKKEKEQSERQVKRDGDRVEKVKDERDLSPEMSRMMWSLNRKKELALKQQQEQALEEERQKGQLTVQSLIDIDKVYSNMYETLTRISKEKCIKDAELEHRNMMKVSSGAQSMDGSKKRTLPAATKPSRVAETRQTPSLTSTKGIARPTTKPIVPMQGSTKPKTAAAPKVNRWR